MNVPSTAHPVIIFDGECGFCDATVEFILEHDPDGVFRFASRQSPEGKGLLVSHGLPEAGVESVVLVEDGRVHVRIDGEPANRPAAARALAGALRAVGHSDAAARRGLPGRLPQPQAHPR